MSKFKNLMSKIVIVFAIALMFGILGHNNVLAQGDDQYTKLLMHMDDSTFKDECGHVITNNGINVSNSTMKFGNGSASFNGTNSYFNSSYTSDWNLGTTFTIDMWVNWNQTPTVDNLFRTCPSSASTSGIYAGFYQSKLWFTATSGTGTWNNLNLTTPFTPKLNTWYHLAFVCDNGIATIYINGSSQGSATLTATTTSNPLMIGYDGLDSNTFFKGYMDEVRISKGIARWTSNFVPLAAPYSLASSITLNKTTDTLAIGGEGTLIATVTPDNATNKTVTWASDNIGVATVDKATGKVTAVGIGTATITATTTDGSNLNASCTVTVTSVPTSTGSAILTITMNNGNVKAYTVSMTKINDFINWYNNRASGSSGNAYYTFDKTDTLQPFTKKTEYVIFDKISSFEVDEYSK